MNKKNLNEIYDGGGIYVSTFRDLLIKRWQIAQNDRNDILFKSIRRICEKRSSTPIP